MPDRTNVVYRYDGSFDGLLCCVYESFYQRETPLMILPEDELQSILFPPREIATDPQIARRVSDAICAKISWDTLEFARRAHLTCLPGREILILQLLRRGFAQGARVLNDLSDDTVRKLSQAVLSLEHEAHLFSGFIRFQDQNSVLTAVIEPKNHVLPIFMAHFCDRFSSEVFLIYDKTHQEALIHQNGQARILSIESFEQAAPNADEMAFRALFKRFCHTIAIPERKNPRCQRSHMPVRYWGQMPEMQAESNFGAPLLAP